jgi:multiple sugar transport system permease protein
VLVALLIMLAPIYWIGATAFKPRNLATTVPPTVFFEPRSRPFAKLFTKRSQLREPVPQEVYDAAPWWERLVFDGGERWCARDRRGQWSGYPNRFMNSLIVAIISTVLAVSMGTITAYGFSRFKVKGEQDWLFFILSPECCRPWWWRSRCS